MNDAERNPVDVPSNRLDRHVRLQPSSPGWPSVPRLRIHTCGLLLCGILLLLGLPGPVSGQQIVGASYTAGGQSHAFLWQNGVMTDLGTLGGQSSVANGINNAGQIVGWANTAAGQSHAFVWQNGVMTDLGTLGGQGSGANGINNTGQIVGYSYTAGGSLHAFLWQNGVMTDLGTLGGAGSLGGVGSYASGINDAAQIVGHAATAAGALHAFLWQNGVMTDLGTLAGALAFSYANGINNAGQIVGYSTIGGGPFHAFLWQNGVMTDLRTLGGQSSFASGINNTGQIVGCANTAGGSQHAFLWQNGAMTDLGTLGGTFSQAFAINDAGQIVGASFTAAGSLQHAFLWQNGVMTDLGAPGGQGSYATAINDPNLLLDPVPDLLNGPAVVKPSDQVGSQTGAQLLATKGTPVQGVAADGVAQVVIRIPAASGDQLTLTMMNDQQVQSISADEDGALGGPGDTNFFQGPIKVTAQDTGKGSFAFAVYRAPVDFARPTGVSTYRSGGCGGATMSDDQSKCRTVSIRVQNQTKGTTTSIQVRILRAPVILVHGLWADDPTGTSWSWNNFGPLFARGVPDSRFFVAAAEYNRPIQFDITATDPSDAPRPINANAMGFLFNAPSVLTRVNTLINTFKGQNPAGIPVAAVQADIVAHSMGGDVVRTTALLANFLQGNFGQGPIHKLITIGTPHLGSPLASQLLSSNCSRQKLAKKGLVTLRSITISGRLVVSGAMGDLAPNSNALAAIANPGPHPHPIPTAVIAGIATPNDLAGLDNPGSNAKALHDWCGTVFGDPLALELTSTGWPTLFSPETSSDGIVGLGSALNTPPNPGSTVGFQFSGQVHSRGIITGLGFIGPSLLDPDIVSPQTVSVPMRVISLLNTPPTPPAFSSINP